MGKWIPNPLCLVSSCPFGLPSGWRQDSCSDNCSIFFVHQCCRKSWAGGGSGQSQCAVPTLFDPPLETITSAGFISGRPHLKHDGIRHQIMLNIKKAEDQHLEGWWELRNIQSKMNHPWRRMLWSWMSSQMGMDRLKMDSKRYRTREPVKGYEENTNAQYIWRRM